MQSTPYNDMLLCGNSYHFVNLRSRTQNHTYDVSCALLAGLGFSATVAGQYIARGGHFHTRAILTDATGVTVWSRGHRRLLGVVTRIFGMVTGSRGHGVTEEFLVWLH